MNRISPYSTAALATLMLLAAPASAFVYNNESTHPSWIPPGVQEVMEVTTTGSIGSRGPVRAIPRRSAPASGFVYNNETTHPSWIPPGTLDQIPRAPDARSANYERLTKEN